MTTVAIPFVRIDASQNPNLAVRKGQDAAEPYFRAMTVAFASLRRWQPAATLEFISNAEPPKVFRAYFDELGVAVKRVPFAHRPPAGFASHFTGSLYLLDALGSLTAEQTILVDPDVLCVGELDSMLQDVGDKAGILRMDFPADEDINGINRVQAGELHGILGEPSLSPEHFGGETYIIPKSQLRQILSRCDRAWELSLARHADGLSKFTTEEHILSYALRDIPHHNLNRHVRRIWTAHRYRLVDGQEGSLTLWHLPAEKDRGFETLFPVVLDRTSWFWTAEREEFVDRAGQAMGFHRRPPMRFAKDCVGYGLRKVQAAVKEIRNLG